MASTTVAFLFAGGMGALVNCYVSCTNLAILLGVQEAVVQPARTLLTALSGFLCGTLVLLVWYFLKNRVVRFLLDYNGWFLRSKSKIQSIMNKGWYLAVIAFLGRKPRGNGWYQDYLPNLPVPNLQDTLKKYLRSVHPVLTEEEYKDTEKAVKEFRSSAHGWMLQLVLKLRSWWKRNWIAEWWLDLIYLKERKPTVLNSNYYAMDKNETPTPHQLDRTAMLLYNDVMFALNRRRGKVETFRGNNLIPFCMNGLRFLHNTVRIPGKPCDRIVCHDDQLQRHVIVYRLGKFYKVEIFSPTGQFMSPKGIRAQLEQVVKMAGNGDEFSTSGVGAFTGLPREKWADVRKRLEANPVNKEILHAIDTSWRFVALETEQFETLNDRGRFLFHGNGYNRWFDKSIQLIVMSDGFCGANTEHTPLDATVAGQLWEYMLTHEMYDAEGHVLDSYPGSEMFDAPPPYELQWDLQDFQEDLKEAKENMKTLIESSDLVVFKADYGKGVPKKAKISPDGWIQMVMQLAYYRTYKKIVLTYESATTRFYYDGRTETIRPVSEFSVEFVKAIDDPSVSRDKVKGLFKKAIDYQCQYKLEAMRGLGVDRHLLGLYILAKGMGLNPMPKIFTDKAFQLPYTLSTSQTPTKFVNHDWKPSISSIGGGFGTVMENGYGVSYIPINDETLYFNVHSRRTCSDTDSKQFGEAIMQAMTDVRSLFGL